jgi:phage tail-like protein
MTISNLDYLYNHLPARFRRADAEQLFLKRFLQWFGEEMDGADLKFDTFDEKINADTAPEEYLDWWLYSLFGWTFFPTWFTVGRKRDFYKSITVHYARRGTERGIRELLAAFGVTAYVQTRPLIWGDFVWGEPLVSINAPLGISVSILPRVDAVNEELSYWGEFIWGESVLASPSEQLQQVDVDALLRFEQPLATVIMVETRQV